MAERPPLSRGQKAALVVLGIGAGSVFLAACYRITVWLLGLG